MNNLVKVSVPILHSDNTIMPNTSPSGTGVFYQAIPALGPNGKNVMKLIPVQRVNGQFITLQNSSPLSGSCQHTNLDPNPLYPQSIQFSPTTVSHSNISILQPAVNARIVLQRPSDGNMLLNPISRNGQLQERMTVSTGTPVHVAVVTPKVSQSAMTVTSPVINCGNTITLLNKKQFPVTLRSPMLPQGHYLQIPSNAQVKSLPASALPEAIKNRIFTPPVSNPNTSASRPEASQQTVLYVSPVNTLKMGGPVQNLSGSVTPVSANQIAKSTASAPTPQSPACNAEPQKNVPKESQRPTTPIRWVIQEGTDSSGPCLVRQKPMSSEILKALAQVEKAKSKQSPSSKIVSQDSQPASCSGKDNALVMCNGKVFFVAKKTAEFGNPSPLVTEKPGGNIDALDGVNKATPSQSDSSRLPATQAIQLTQEQANKANEIIDLCEDDAQDDCIVLTQNSTRRTLTDEDDEDCNVIFVSYIPPKPVSSEQCESQQSETSENKIPLEAASAQEYRTETMNAEISCSNTNVSMQINAQCDGIPLHGEQDSGEASAASQQQVQPESDSQLKRRFGIKAEVQIHLKRILYPEQKTESCPKKMLPIPSINKRTLDGIRKLIQSSEFELKTRKLIAKQSPKKKENEHFSLQAKKKRAEPGEGADGESPQSETENGDFQHSSCVEAAGQSREEMLLQSAPASVVPDAAAHLSVLEPQRPCGGANELEPVLPLHVTWQTEARAEGTISPSKNKAPKSRRGRGKQSRSPRTKTRVRLEGSEPKQTADSVFTESLLATLLPTMSHHREQEPASVEIHCPSTMTDLNSSSTEEPPSENFSATPMEPEEIKRHEKIKRLKELLKEKEAALEIFRKSLI